MLNRLVSLLKRLFHRSPIVEPPAGPIESVELVEPSPVEAPQTRKRSTRASRQAARRNATIDWILEMMSYSVPEGGSIRKDRLGLDYFDGAEPLTRLADLYTPAELEHKINMGLTPAELGSWDQSMITNLVDEEDETKNIDGFTLVRCRRVSLRHIRGAGRIVGSQACELAVAAVLPNKTFLPLRTFWTWTGQRWLRVDSNTDKDSPLLRMISGAMGVFEYGQGVWHVRLGWPECPQIAFETDPVGAREVFRLRDIPEGRARRAALRNWVSEHWRKPASSEDNKEALIQVRAHLRGAMRFSWAGLNCTLVPSAVDRRKNLETVQAPPVPIIETPDAL